VVSGVTCELSQLGRKRSIFLSPYQSRCDEFARKGCTVFATARNVARLSNLPDSVHKLALDVTSEKSVQLAVQQVLDISGCIDVLVNNAGIECVGE
jgi:1-acylglycerone phosphate reductase